MTDRPKGSIAAWWADSHKLPRGSYLGTADVAGLLGVSRQRVSQLQRGETFPRPMSRGWGAYVWHAAGIHCWAAKHRPERAEAAGRFGREAGGLLATAEANARGLGVHWIDTWGVWLAVANGGAGSGLSTALVSMGATAQELEAWLVGIAKSNNRPRVSYRMTPVLQQFLARADRAVAADGRDIVRPVDILLAFIDAKWERHAEQRKARPTDHFLDYVDRRGLDISELRRRLVAADGDPTSVEGFDQRRLRRPRAHKPRLRSIDLAKNPLGHDPWTRFPWGAVFARTRDEQHLKVDGEVWFFKIDGDGFILKSVDGHPIGYRYRMDPPPRPRRGQRSIKPVNGFMEILPMPPVEMADWPDRQFGNED